MMADAEVSEKAKSAGLGKQGIDLRGSHLDAIMFNDGTLIKEAVGHPGLLGLAFGAFVIHRLGKSDRNFGERLPRVFEAYARIGVVQPITNAVGALNGQSVMLMLADVSRQI